jgi:Aspartyl protease
MAIVSLSLMNDLVDPEAIDVWIDGWVGDDPVRFRLDTGAARCIVPVLDSLRQLERTGVDSGVGLSGVGPAEEDEILVPQFRFDDLVIKDVVATRSVSGTPLLGMPALSRYRCEFRFNQGQLEFGDGKRVESEQWSDLAMHALGQPMVPIHFDAATVEACWDTGAGLTAVDLGFAEAHPRLFEPIRTASGIDAGGVEIPSRIARMAACRIGGIAFDRSACALVDMRPVNATLEQPITFVLGMPAIIQADWCFDFPRRRWSVAKRTTSTQE